LRALMSAPTSGKAWDLRCHVREELVKYLQREYPQSLPRIRAEIRQTDEKAAVPDKRPPPEVIRDGTSSFAASGKVAPSADSQGS
jgi:hypothetical protein